MDRFIHCVKSICKKRLLPLALVLAMLLPALPPTAMAAPARAATVQNQGFESGNLNGWTVLTPGWAAGARGGYAGVVNARSTGEYELPTNQSGSYHLSGLSNGIAGAAGWELRSSTFLLSGSGWISVKMGGRAAAVKVFLSNGTQVGYFRQNRYNDVNFPYLSMGGSWNDMATYVMDLSDHLGKELYVVLCDEAIDGGAAYASFDDVITYYDAVPNPAFRFDTVTDGHAALSAASEVQIPWVRSYNLLRYYSEYEVKNGGFESGDLTDWTVLTEGFDAAKAVVSAHTYWDQQLPYNQSGEYHLNGWSTGIPEAQGWAVRSNTFVLGGSGFLTVKMGGNAAAASICLTDGTQIAYSRNFRFHDVSFPHIAEGGAWCDMATYVFDLSAYLGRQVYVELRDEVITDGWANAFFDDVVSYYETAPKVSGRFDKVPDGHLPGERAKLTHIPWVSVPVMSTAAARQIPNGDFETGDLSGWTILGSGFPIKNGLPAANADTTYWAEELPYNKSGSYFVNGSALSGNEANTWRIRSSPFKLEGSGWISVKMGGHAAAVRVYKMDGTLVGEFDQCRFCDREFPYIANGGSWYDMGVVYMDLSTNLGDVLYLELCDDPIKGGWANATFDDVVTYYAKKPAAKTERVTDGHRPAQNGRAAERAGRAKIESVVAYNNLYSPRNGGFELGNLTGWTVESKYFYADDAVVAAESYNLDVVNEETDMVEEYRKLPYNTSGNHLLSGHDAAKDEDTTWELRSSPFTLAGSGYISVKMGGHAAAFEVRTAADNKIVAYCQQRRFNDINFPYLSKGGSWRDMATYVMDLSDYLGQKLVVVLMDEETTGWADAYFDDVICYYAQKPNHYQSDTVTDGYFEYRDTPKEIKIPWIYLDDFEEDNEIFGRFPLNPITVKDISCTIEPKTGVNLYNFFAEKQGMSSYDVAQSKLTFSNVRYYGNGGEKTAKFGYTNFDFSDYGLYVINYRFEQVGRTQTGKFTVTVSNANINHILNGGFETGDLAGWTPEYWRNANVASEVVWPGGEGNYVGVNPSRTYWTEKAPYNQSGSYHLGGFEGVDAPKIPEEATWRLRSSTFTLGGSGWITAKMGGHAAYIEVFKVEEGKEDTMIGRYAQSRFADTSGAFPDITKGSWLDMATYAIDLSAYKGSKLYIVLCDNMTGGWGHAVFDEIVTYYENTPDWESRSDTVKNGNNSGNVDIPWQLVGSFGTSAALSVETTIEDGTATISTISTETIAAAVAEAGGGLATLTLDATGGASGNTTALSIPAAAIKAISDNSGVSNLDVKLGSGELTLDAAVLTKVAEANGGTVAMSLAKVDTSTLTSAQQTALNNETESLVLNISITANAEEIHELGGNLTVSVPFAPQVGNAANYKLYHLKNDGNLEPVVGAVFSDGKVTFSTDHLSVWVALYKPDENLPNGGFETGDLTGWTVLTEGDVKTALESGGVIGDSTYAIGDGSEQPYNQSGDYHLGGQDTQTHIAEHTYWRIKSSNFILDGSGWITVKMGGNAAAVEVRRASNDALVGKYRTRFVDEGYPNVNVGRWLDMATYAIDLSALRSGEAKPELYLVLCAEQVGSWEYATFDQIVTYYAQAPSLDQYETVTNAKLNGVRQTPEQVNIQWQLAHNMVPGIKAAPTAVTGLAYTGEAQALVAAGTVTGGEMTYSTDGTAYTSAIPTGTDAGSYTVWYRAESSAYQPTEAASVTVTIDKAAASVTTAPTAASLTYNAQPQALVTAGTANGGAMQYSLDGANYSGLIPTGINAGSYTVYYKAAGDSNHTDFIPDSNSIAVTIDKAVPAFTAPTAIAGLKYTGAAQALVNAGSVTDGHGSMLYCLTESGAYSSDIPTGSANGAYTVYYKVVADESSRDNYQDSAVMSTPASIGMEAPTVTPPAAKELVYSGAPQALITAGTVTGGTMWYKLGNGEYSASVPTATEVGDYTVFYKVVGDSGYSSVAEASVSVRIKHPYNVVNGGFETGDLTGWTHTFSKNPIISAATYWGEKLPFNNNGPFLSGFDTGIEEANIWTVQSSTFTLGGSGFISVRMGGHAAAVHVYQADGTEIASCTQTRFNDVNFPRVGMGGSWADMATYVMDLSSHVGEELYIKLCDEAVAGWAQAFFDEIVTYYEVAPDWANRYDVVVDGKKSDADRNNPDIYTAIPWQKVGEAKRDAFGLSIENGGFETGDLTGWTTETAGFNTATAVISAAAYWGENLPYNQAGDYHLDGWNTGIGEGDTWTVRSGTFTLGGSGYISVRMGGHAAAVHVYQTDGTEIGYYKQNRFADHDFPYLKNGGSWADMGTYVIDLSEYLGNDLYIELCDEAVDGWAHAFFDEVVTYYATVPNYQSLADTVIDGNNSGAVDIPWQLATNLHGLMGMSFSPMMLSLSAPTAEPLPLPETPEPADETPPENAETTDAAEPADDAVDTETDPAEPVTDDTLVEPVADEPEPAAPANEEDVPTPKEEDDPDDEDSPDQEGEPESEGEPEPEEASDAESSDDEP